MHPVRRQRGAILVMTALFIVVLIGVAALAMDIGRLVVLRAQLQNAADAAAIAAAMELDGKSGARERAMAAARWAITHDQSFATINNLLGDGLPNDAFSFFCVIGAEYDPDPSKVDIGNYCSNTTASADEPAKYPTTEDTDAHYVRIDLDPAKAPGRFELDLFFLPVLNLIAPGTATVAATRGQALAGRHSIQCNYPPMAICDPFEGTGKTFKTDMPIGTTVILRNQGGSTGQWSPGNAGFLMPINNKPGGKTTAESLAFPDDAGCAPRRVSSEPGQIVQKTTSAINTRFDLYDPHFKENTWADWPPAPNIYAYQDATSPVAVPGLDVEHFVMPDWQYEEWRTAQSSAYGALPGTEPSVVGGKKPLRWDVYKWEIANNRILKKPIPAHTPGAQERRLLAVAVLSCQALGAKGKFTVPVNSPDGFAKFFLYKEAVAPGPPPGSEARIFGEYVGWYGEGDANYHVETQLYE